MIRIVECQCRCFSYLFFYFSETFLLMCTQKTSVYIFVTDYSSVTTRFLALLGKISAHNPKILRSSWMLKELKDILWLQPSQQIIWPKNDILLSLNWHFSLFSLSHDSNLIRFKTLFKIELCSFDIFHGPRCHPCNRWLR